MVRQIADMADPNVLVMKQRCMMHQANLTTEQMWKTLGVLLLVDTDAGQLVLRVDLSVQAHYRSKADRPVRPAACQAVVRDCGRHPFKEAPGTSAFALVILREHGSLLDFINCFRKRGLSFSVRQGGAASLHFL
ncbi:unnamed protein product [Symbiodinium necroappetens]|uniref:Uncharacterized protein n=1 Tax=Symbiodinium necroappetens TaxID=1628268 RepID=A0A812Z667_9DINO|nr:unnamed protein product [Symbiodinium necroappetens]